MCSDFGFDSSFWSPFVIVSTVVFLGTLLFLGLFSMAFLVDFCLLDSLSFYLDFIVVLGCSGVLSHGADYFMIF